jgi:hypothetical protein
MANQRMVFPEPAMNGGVYQRQVDVVMRDSTFAIYPQQGASRVPFLEDLALYKPCRRSLVVSM